VLLRAGQSLLEPHLVTAPGGLQTDSEPHPEGWAAQKRANPPGTWTESGQTPILSEVSSSPLWAPALRSGSRAGFWEFAQPAPTARETSSSRARVGSIHGAPNGVSGRRVWLVPDPLEDPTDEGPNEHQAIFDRSDLFGQRRLHDELVQDHSAR